MFVYAFLILLPAAALADTCDKAPLYELFRILDKDNNTKVSLDDDFALFKDLDRNRDGKVTLAEAKAYTPINAPSLVGKEDDIVAVLDFNKDGEITKQDIKFDFFFIDTNHDNFKDKDEWKRFVEVLCPLLFPRFPKFNCLGCLTKCGSH